MLVLSPEILEEYRRVGHEVGRSRPTVAAADSQTTLIVSGDGDLLRVSGWRGVEVLTPRQFLDRHLGANG